MNAPCLNCIERKLHCHSSCGKYIKYQQQQEKVREVRCAKDVDEFEVNKVMRRRAGIWR